MRWRAAEMRHALALDQRQRLRRVEHLLQYQHAAGEDRLQYIEQPPVESDRQKHEQYAVWADAVSLVDEAGGAIGRVVQVQYRLRITGRAGGEGGARQVRAFRSTSAEQFPIERWSFRRVEKPAQVEVFGRHVVADNEHIPQMREVRPQPPQHVEVIEAPELPRQDQGRSLGEAQDELDLASSEIDVELAEWDAGQHRRVDRDRELAPVRQLDRNDIIGPEPEPDEMRRQPLGAPEIRAVAQSHAAVDDRQLVRALARQSFESVVAGGLRPIAEAREFSDPCRIDRRVGYAHPCRPYTRGDVDRLRSIGYSFGTAVQARPALWGGRT